jgi:hypothetical protein
MLLLKICEDMRQEFRKIVLIAVGVILLGMGKSAYAGPSFNHPPQDQDGIVTTFQDQPVEVHPHFYDEDRDPLKFSIVDPPLNGILTGDPPILRYKPLAGFTGTDRFTFLANDGQADGNVGTINLNVLPYQVSLSNVAGEPGQTALLSIFAEKSLQRIVSFQIDLQIISLGIRVPKLSPTFSLGDATQDWELRLDANSDNFWRFTVLNDKQKIIDGPTELAKINLAVPFFAPEGSVYQVNIVGMSVLYLSGKEQSLFAIREGKLTVASQNWVKGDLNGDQSLTITDVVLLLLVLANGGGILPEQVHLIDMDGDNRVSFNDAKVMLRVVAGLLKP